MSSGHREADPVADTVGYQLKRAQHGLRLAIDAALRPIQLTTPQYAVLDTLGQAAGLSGAELARRAFVTPQTMNAIVMALEREGLVARQPHATHGRVLQAYLTDIGEQRLRAARQAVFDIQEDMLAGLGTVERTRLTALLGCCADRLEVRADAGGRRAVPRA